jgi:hypothetical protein
MITLKCGTPDQFCGQTYQCDGAHACPDSQATKVEPAPAGMLPADNALVTPTATCNAACTNSIDCGSHWIEGSLSRNGGLLNKYRNVYLDAVVPDLGPMFQESNPLIGKTRGWGLMGNAGFNGGIAVATQNEFAAFWLPASGVSTRLLSYKNNTAAYLQLAVDGKNTSLQPLNSIDTPPITFQYPVTVPTGSERPFVCQANACRIKSNPTDPTCTDTATTHFVQIINKNSTAALPRYLFIDAIVENGTITEETTPRIT